MCGFGYFRAHGPDGGLNNASYSYGKGKGVSHSIVHCSVDTWHPRSYPSLMPRKLRLQYKGAVYHLISRGNRRGPIFLNDVDRHDFVKTLAERIIAEELVRHGWTESDLANRRKNDR